MTTPAWHDVPPVPGDYQVRYFDGSTGLTRLRESDITSPWPNAKYYGPLPDPPPIPEPPKVKLYRAKHGVGKDRFILVFSEGIVRAFDGHGYYANSSMHEEAEYRSQYHNWELLCEVEATA